MGAMGGSAGECVDGLALVLQSKCIDIADRLALFACCLGKGGCAEADGEGTCICGENDVLAGQFIEQRSKVISRAVQRRAHDLREYTIPCFDKCAANTGTAVRLCSTAKDHGDALCGSGNLLGIVREVAQECGLLPYTAEKEPRETKRGEEGKLCACRLCLCNLRAYRCCIEVGASGNDLH